MVRDTERSVPARPSTGRPPQSASTAAARRTRTVSNAGMPPSRRGSAAPSISVPTRNSMTSVRPPSRPASAASNHNTVASNEHRAKREGEDVRVYVRVRGHAPNEPDVSQPVLSTSGPRGRQIQVALGAQPSVSQPITPSLPVTDGREKTYTFDGVFGPDADQSIIYQDVVSPILKDVLNGYKCTIFAYGQTGTGKTHTMEGKLGSDSGFHIEAGIIPRTLDRLFHQVEMSDQELRVRMTFLELYNEELRDLLSSVSPAAASRNQIPLKIWEDKGKDGATVRGLNELPIGSAEDGLKFLRMGSNKRQVATTNCNDASSRSHSICSLTVYSRSADGADEFRVGKLNLVDLAGSESIERSGAKEKGAREAGMINKSLLTLGRVINALVEGSPHVPYRESNLTRLLQDSLGGGTKTCIIATVSQAKANVDETLSTLDYALRAKSIKNRPELNSKATRPGLLHEMEHKCRELWSDLQANIMKEGHYVSEDHWARMVADLEAMTRARDELRRENEVVKAKAVSWEEQVDQYVQRDRKRQIEFDSVKTEAAEYKSALETTQAELAAERAQVGALTTKGKHLYASATSLQYDLSKCVDENVGLRAKIERLQRIERDIVSRIAHYEQAFPRRLQELRTLAADIEKTANDLDSNTSEAIKTFESQLTQERTDFEALVAQQQQTYASYVAQLADQRQHTDKGVVELCAEQTNLLNEWASKAKEQRDAATTAISERTKGVIKRFNKGRTDLQRTVGAQAEVAGTLITMGQEHLTALGSKLQELSQIIVSARTSRAEARKQEHTVFAEEMTEVVQRLNKLIEKSAARVAAEDAVEGEQEATHNDAIHAVQECAGNLWTGIDGTQTVLKQRHKDVYSAFKREGQDIQKQLEGVSQSASEEIGSQSQLWSDGISAMESSLAESQAKVAKSVHTGFTTARALGDAAGEAAGASLRYAGANAHTASTFSQTHSATVANHGSTTRANLITLDNRIESLRSDADQQLQQQIRPYAPTAKTPKPSRYHLDYSLEQYAESLGADLFSHEGKAPTSQPDKMLVDSSLNLIETSSPVGPEQSSPAASRLPGPSSAQSASSNRSLKAKPSPLSPIVPTVKDMNRSSDGSSPEETLAKPLAGTKRPSSDLSQEQQAAKRFHA